MPLTFSAWRISSWTLPTSARAAPSYAIWTPWQGTCASSLWRSATRTQSMPPSLAFILATRLEEQERGGVRYALKSKQYLNNEDYALLHNLHPGNAQFFDFGEMLGPTTQSIWVSAEGFFYILSFRPADVQQKKFDSPAGYYRLGMGRKRARTRARHTN